jgi:hypothetical protein
MPDFPTIIIFGNIPLLWDFLKGVFLLAATTIILYFILRSIFRFAVYSGYSSDILHVTEDDAKKVAQDYAEKRKKPIAEYESLELLTLHEATSREVYSKKIYWVFPANLFFTSGDPTCPSHESRGIGILFLISLGLAFLLLLFLW